jgi:crotonobetainyl-CoA:carnitine CoA-transferase CaiB-like acyl-CoA transferase
MTSTKPTGPLAGIRVIDMTTVFMGPSATQMLGDLGADVIKVEMPGGDPTRGVGPNGETGMGPLFLGLNRNKRSIELDLKSPEGIDALLSLVKSADVLVSNIRPAAMARLGLSKEQLVQANPKLIHAALVGFSQKGPYARKAAYDDLMQNACGLAFAMSQGNGGTPSYLPITIADRSVGIYAFGVISAALFARTQTGEGQTVEIPMFEVMTAYVLGDHLYGHTFVPPRAGFGYPRIMSPNRRPYRTKDGYVCCVIYTDRDWRVFLKAVGKEDLWKSDPRFRDIRARTENIDSLYQMVADELQTRTTADWNELLAEAEIPVFPMHTFESLLKDEHLTATGFFQEVDHPTVGRLRQMTIPSEWSGTTPTTYNPVPTLGEHTAEILREVGYTKERIDLLQATVQAARSPQ